MVLEEPSVLVAVPEVQLVVPVEERIVMVELVRLVERQVEEH